MIPFGIAHSATAGKMPFEYHSGALSACRYTARFFTGCPSSSGKNFTWVPSMVERQAWSPSTSNGSSHGSGFIELPPAVPPPDCCVPPLLALLPPAPELSPPVPPEPWPAELAPEPADALPALEEEPLPPDWLEVEPAFPAE